MACFDATAQYEAANRVLYKVLNAAQGSLERMHLEAAALRAEHPDWTKVALREAMFPGLARRGASVDVEESFLERSVADNWSALAEFGLVNVIARYEAWTDAVVAVFPATLRFLPGQRGWVPTRHNTAYGLQFPFAYRDSKNRRWRPGYPEALRRLKSTGDPLLESSVRSVVCRSRKTDPTHLKDLLTAYRYFKAVRNALVHEGGNATPEVVTSGRAARHLRGTVGSVRLPPMTQLAKGDSVTLSMRDVAQFDAVVSRIVRIIDTELLSSEPGAALVEQRAREFCSSMRHLPTDTVKRGRRLKRILANVVSVDGRLSGLQPTPVEIAQFETFLRDRRIVA
jgi:hypothetical protein